MSDEDLELDNALGIDPDQPYTLALEHPVQWGQKQIAELVLRPVTGADLRKLKTPQTRPMAMVLELAGYLSGQVPQVLDRVKGPDLGRVMEVTNFFFASSQGIGVKPSPLSE